MIFSPLDIETQVDSIARSGRPQPGEPLTRGSNLGRYVVIDTLGRGGMGTVYRAYDPELDRIVALKHVHGERATDPLAQARLQREAQAIAKLSHPNLVQVYDVGTAADGQTMFIAMEFVPGQTLRRWIKEERRDWRSVARVFAGAGRGLLAAHERELVHRDFKPENVLVTEDGAAKVVDFGLAKPTSSRSRSRSDLEAEEASLSELLGAAFESVSSEGPDPSSLQSAPSASSALSSNLTRAGARVGTPAYMPPEQISGMQVDARADQFSFAVTLYEALFGRLPFSGKTPEAYAVAVIEGKVRRVPTDSSVPKSLQRVLLRALATDPGDRFETLEPLVAELERDPRRERRRLLGLVAALSTGAIVAAGAAWFLGQEDPELLRCRRSASVVEESWNPATRSTVEAALSEIDRNYAGETAELVTKRLDRWASEWARIREGLCVAPDTASIRAMTQTLDEAPPGGLDDDPSLQLSNVQGLREAGVSCLQANLASQRRIVHRLEHPNPSTLEGAIQITTRLEEELLSCTDPAVLGGLASTRLDSALAAIYEELVEVDHGDQYLGQIPAARARLDRLPRPPEDGSWPAVLTLLWARVHAYQAYLEGDPERGLQIMRASEAMVVGEAAQVDAYYWYVMLAELQEELGDLDGMAATYIRTHVLGTRIFRVDSPDYVRAMSLVGYAHYARGEYDRALERYQAASAHARDHLPNDDPATLEVDEHVARVLGHLGRTAEAMVILESIHEKFRSRFGGSHPETLSVLHSLGVARLRHGDFERALADFETELGLQVGEDDVTKAGRSTTWASIAGAQLELSRAEDAERSIKKALGLAEQNPSVDSTTRGIMTALLAAAYNQQGKFDEAMTLHEQALERHRADDTEATTNGLMTRHNLAQALVGLGRVPEAQAVLDDALGLTHAGTSPDVVQKLETQKRGLE